MITVAIILILVGMVLIGLGTRPGPKPTYQLVEETDPSRPTTGEAPEAATPDHPAEADDPTEFTYTDDLTYPDDPGDTDDPGDADALADPADPPEEIAAPTPPLVMVTTRPFVPLVPPGHESTAAERRKCREQAGSELDADLAEVVRLIESKPPELRGMLMNASSSVVAQELSVLRAYLRGALTGLDVRLRTGSPDDLRYDSQHEEDRATMACLVSGLGRLPTHHGVCFHRTHRGEVPMRAFFPGSVLTEPAFTRAERTTFPAAGVSPGPLINYVIWSESGRRTPLLVGHTDTVLFPAATRFRVLALDHQHGDATVYLVEETTRPTARNRREHQVLEHLRNQALTAGVGPIDGPTPSPVPHPGLDNQGHPFVLSTGNATGNTDAEAPTVV
ncbi:hypothetical protein LR393_01770 [Kineosporia mesophila]|uniref:hypothetical protein n=1 Tax=Kineosporia mesophila TaxID=566012 RepID=UPI001E51FC43|nr:hypothetical protein [Kineosporia mesophila]MCD5348801.1 hypothetical protein [Kineosporia mesophila]